MRVLSDGLFLRGQRFFLGRDEIEANFARHREIDGVFDNLGVKAEAAILLDEPFSDAMAGFGAGKMRLGGEMAEIGFGVRRVRDGEKLLFKRLLGGGVGRKKTGNGRRVLETAGKSRNGEEKEREEGGYDGDATG